LAEAPHKAETFAVYGALVLRGAVSAAHAGRRGVADALLEAADAAARQVGEGGNLRWTGFDATNVLLRRLNVALTFADAGRAIAVAGKVDVGKVKLAERKASLHLDIAQTNALCERVGRGTGRDAGRRAGRPAGAADPSGRERMVLKLAAQAPRTISSEATDLARRCGIAL
jgi:hypothetical protein